ncbi:MAG: protein-disulfide reductase DsbD family protein [Acidobacteriaceae bacterium]
MLPCRPIRTSRHTAALLSLLIACGLLLAPAPAGAQAPINGQDSAATQQLAVKLLVPPAQIYPGQTFHGGLQFQIAPGWHIYWINAGDSGEPPAVQWTLPKGITAGSLQYPPPTRLPLGPLMDFGYQNQVVLPIPFKVATDFQPKSNQVPFIANVSWLVCQNVCLPGHATLRLTRTALTAAPAKPTIDANAQQSIAAFLAKMPQPLPPDAVARFQPTAHGFRLAVRLGHKVTHAEFFPLDFTVIANAAPQKTTPTRNGFILDLTKDGSLTTQPKHLHGVLEIPGSPAYLINTPEGPLPTEPASGFAFGALLGAIGLALLGGIILNLMPCVFPVLFIKGLALVQSSQHDRRSMRAHGWTYTAGIVLSFWVILSVLLILRAAGQQLGWGFQFQSPVMLALLAMLFFFLGLSLAGQFEIGLSLTSVGGGLAQKQGYAGSFFTGVLAMVVATPCTAPFMGPAIGYALSHSAFTSFCIFTTLGLGLALPYLLLVYFPGWARLLPRPGAWMEILKQAFSIPIFGAAIWLTWLYAENAGSAALLALLAAFLLLAIAGWFLGRWPAKIASTITAILVIVAAIALPAYAASALPPPSQSSTQSSSKASGQTNWQPYTPALLQQYLSQGKPVFVDFTADWCLSCQVNQRVVLDRPDVQRRLANSGVQLLKADWTRHDPAITQALARLGRSGIPTYALYSGKSGQPPQLLPAVLTPGILFSALDSIHTTNPPPASAANNPPSPNQESTANSK